MIDTIIVSVELIFIVLIWKDDRAQRRMAEQSLVIQKESLDAQKQYLDLRRCWYESRAKKKEEKLAPALEAK